MNKQRSKQETRGLFAANYFDHLKKINPYVFDNVSLEAEMK